MIILPTEKKFDWRYTPVILFLIVLINILVFFLYQSGDVEKQYKALNTYTENAYLEWEWPIYQDYLATQDQGAREDAIQIYEKGLTHDLAIKILIDRSFYKYLQKNARNYLKEDVYDEWQTTRASIQASINSISAFAYGLTPRELKYPTLLTHQFLHGGLLHLAGNLFFLVICGFAVEASIGHLRFLLYYLVSGAVAGLAHSLLDLQSGVPLVGASGAISGVMAMYLAIFRLRKIEFFYWLFVFVGYFRAPALFILPFYLGKEVYSYYSNPDGGVAFMAHVGGFCAGAILISIELMINRNMLNMEYIEDDQNGNPEQERLAEIYDAIGSYRFKDALASLGSYETEYGKNFNSLILRYNLTKVRRGDDYKKAVLHVFDYKNPLQSQLEKIALVCRENLDVVEQLDGQKLVRLGVMVSESNSPEVAERLFALAVKRAPGNMELGVFARKLSLAFEHLKDHTKKQKYAQLADKILESQNGVL